MWAKFEQIGQNLSKSERNVSKRD